MKKNFLIIISIVIIAIVTALMTSFTNIFYYFKSLSSEKEKYPSTYFIEPSNLFKECHTTDDCIKVKGTSCPPSKGGVETCVNKNYMQEYLSNIETLTDKEWESNCPNIDSSTDRECSCVNNVCDLVI